MEIQEEIHETTDQGLLSKLNEENEERIKETIKMLQVAFEAHDVVAAKEQSVKLNYWKSIAKLIDGKLHD